MTRTKKKRYQGKKTRTKTQGTELESNTNFKGLYTDLEGCIFDLGLRSPEKFDKTMKNLEQYLGANYSIGCQTDIMTETPETLPDPNMPTITPVMGTDCTNVDGEMTYL